MFTLYLKKSRLLSSLYKQQKLYKLPICKSFTSDPVSNFEPKIDEDKLDDEDKQFLKEKDLLVHSDTDMRRTIKILIRELNDLTKENNKLHYRIENLLRTINTLEGNLNNKSL